MSFMQPISIICIWYQKVHELGISFIDLRNRNIRSLAIHHPDDFIYHKFDLLYDGIIFVKLRLSIEKAFCIGGSSNKPQHKDTIFFSRTQTINYSQDIDSIIHRLGWPKGFSTATSFANFQILSSFYLKHVYILQY